MSAVNHRRVSTRRRFLEAADWQIRMRDPEFQLQEWERWLKWHESPENQQAFTAVESLCRELEYVTRHAAASGVKPPPEQEIAPVSVHDVADAQAKAADATLNGEGVAFDVASTPSSWRSPSPWKLVAGIAVLALAAVLTLAVLTMGSQTIQTAASEWTKELLDDGTVVRVGPNTRLVVKFSDDQRLIKLTRGEALFEVAQESARSFVVSTDQGRVSVEGTQFGVTNLGDQVIVTVREGVVAVSPRPATRGVQPEPTRIAAGEQATLSGSGPIEPRKVNTARELQWIGDDWCVFEGETVAEAAREFNRRNRLQIQIQGKDIAGHRLGYRRFKCADPESFARTVQAGGGIEVEMQGSILKLKATNNPRPDAQPPSR